MFRGEGDSREPHDQDEFEVPMRHQGREHPWAIGCTGLEPRDGGQDHTQELQQQHVICKRKKSNKRLMRKGQRQRQKTGKVCHSRKVFKKSSQLATCISSALGSEHRGLITQAP